MNEKLIEINIKMNTSNSNWESERAYLTKKFHELSLDQLLEASGKSMIRLKSPLLRRMTVDSEEEFVEGERQQELQKRIQDIYSLLRDRKFFTDRQRQVLSLLFGWNGNTFVGPKSVSDIAKVIGVAQPVAFNHLRLAIRKLKKHFGIARKKDKNPRQKFERVLADENPGIAQDHSPVLDIE